ncbi:mitogen-activated protein kinase phosphatase 1, putative [Plasmodium yoelii]|uniref:Mitogen-activated protein kinase phosphatase 1 n=2 Tax=Plasmodium yoelii TaxID=5861 RepID=A0AAE9WX50_PLAYO|nr:mitogen-activated protein kinase phosphatase 1, putative [Plasmodium yoelii]WBY60606.1 mitogen-activated protein kinase phosphatase 1 [Plasmodium yoelii yoelii]CDU20411.1 mitogen-activated protein kinase phosphatase 1, putative [Plasmodium yoelii]VTZ81371.1 mitogen-activated protein kinase phosphatase 1, putative [Plasmodium yoelii]|eukprot:XP_725337.2 mitogen-activated protein kinase phosphatase 1, putative [Plasmodium yoelii]
MIYDPIDFEALKKEIKNEEENNSIKTDNQYNILSNAKIKFKIINSFYLYNYMQLLLDQGKNKTIFIVDIRNENFHNQGYIKNSIHINDANKINTIKNEIIKKKNENIKIIFYDNEDVQDLNKYQNIVAFHFSELKADFYFLKGGYTNWKKKFYFLCLKGDQKDASMPSIIVNTTLNTTPNHINSLSTIDSLASYINYPIKICDNVYVGNLIHINNALVYHYLEILCVYDLTSSGFVMKNNKGIKYLRYNTAKGELEHKNFKKDDSINYTSFLDNCMISHIISSMVLNINFDHIEDGKIENNSDNTINKSGKNILENNAIINNNKHQPNNLKKNILIICNDGIKDESNKQKMNSISLIISMCYIIYSKKYNLNLAIAYMIKICNNLSISSQTRTILQNFYNYLVRINFNIHINPSSKDNINNRKCKIENFQDSSINIKDNPPNNHNNRDINQPQISNSNKSMVVNALKNEELLNLIKKYEVNISHVLLDYSNEYVIYINREYIIEDIEIIEEKAQEIEYTYYEYLIQSLLYYIYNKKEQDINFDKINIVLKILKNINSDNKIDNSYKFPYCSLILISLCKILNFENSTEFENTEKIKYESYTNIKFDVFSILCNSIITCIDFIIYNYENNCNFKIASKEYELTIKTTSQDLKDKSIDKNIYMIFLSLKYLLSVFFQFYLYPSISKNKSSYIDQMYNTLQQIDKFADYYYSIFNININSFINDNYKAQVCPFDYLPLYLSDILRPFIIITNYLE